MLQKRGIIVGHWKMQVTGNGLGKKGSSRIPSPWKPNPEPILLKNCPRTSFKFVNFELLSVCVFYVESSSQWSVRADERRVNLTFHSRCSSGVKRQPWTSSPPTPSCLLCLVSCCGFQTTVPGSLIHLYLLCIYTHRFCHSRIYLPSTSTSPDSPLSTPDSWKLLQCQLHISWSQRLLPDSICQTVHHFSELNTPCSSLPHLWSCWFIYLLLLLLKWLPLCVLVFWLLYIECIRLSSYVSWFNSAEFFGFAVQSPVYSVSCLMSVSV